MENILKFLLIYFIIAVVEVRCSNNIVAINQDVSISSNTDGTIFTLIMDENNHDFDGVEETPHTPLFKIIDVSYEPSISFIQSTFRHSIEVIKEEPTSYIFYSNQSFDYETQAHTYSFNLFINDEAPVIILNINNTDDEPPSLTPPQCEFEENTIFTVENSNCTCTVSDPDGWLSQMKFPIVKDDRFHADEIFELKFREDPADDVYSADVYVTVKQELNYQAVTFYLFDIKAEDGAGHPTTPNELVRGLVNVIDLPDTPPEWTSFFTTAQFKEQSDQVFTVTAIDGDYGLDYEINYSKLWEDDEEANYISIDNNGTITVKKIDRDKDDISTYNFEIMAYEVPNAPIWNNTLNITFYIIDIDNNPPLVRWVDYASQQNTSFDDVTDKSVTLSFLENYAGNLNLTIYIKDIDTGENAQFTVELEDLEDNDIAYTDAFLIVPTAGYRNGEFQITVRNATYLDYEVVEWVHITFNVLTTGVLDPIKQDRMLVDITLIDYNDEFPIFEESEYSVSILETAKKGDHIITILATDRDAEDKILTHSLIGSTYTNRVLDIIPETGEIFVGADNAFDYDTVNPIFVQVRATDKALHNTTVPLTIMLLDVNNKAPTISVGDPINVDENQNATTRLNASITASDMDTTADLSAEIDWENSYVMKNSRRLDMNNETISQQVKFLDATYERVDSEDDTNKDIRIYLVVNDNNPNGTTPDFELFDSLYISLKVTDWNTDPEFMANQNTSALILISINDINDNTPFFPEADPDAEPVNRTVQEAAPIGTSVGSITAIDYDVGDTVTYDCKPNDANFDWIEVHTDTGAFIVKSELIDADTDKTYYFNYTCTASDNGFTHTSEPLTVRFYIIDTNNQVPVITIADEVHVDEKSPALTEIEEIGTSDMDRDIPFHTVECTLDRLTVCADKFFIEDNIIKVRTGKDDIDRDEGDETYSCPMTCTDNPDRLQNDRNPNTVAHTFTIVLDDINDHTPIVLTDKLVTIESLQKDETVGVILATDIDKGDNAEIDFNVTRVVDSNGDEIVDIFETRTDDDYYVDLTHKQANLVAIRDLKGLYGTYTVTIGAADRGTPPNSNFTDIIVEIDKFNFESPRFVFPSANDKNIILLSSQQPFSQLILYSRMESNYLQDFYATDNSEQDTCNKWDVTIDFEQISPEDDNSLFTMFKNGTCAGQLQVTNRFDSETVLGKLYELKLIARVRDGEPLEGEQPYTTETKINVNFMDNDQKPIFNCSNMVFKFREELLGQTQPLDCPASYVPIGDTLPIFYFLDKQSASDIVQDTFDIDVNSGDISLKQTISFKQNEQLQFSVVASNDINSPSSYNQMSYLNVTCNVIEINNNYPQWTRASYFGAIMTGYNRNTVVVTVEATDADKIDQGHLTYNINGSVAIHGSGLNNLPSEPFTISETLGEIRLNFQVDSTMSGYFQFQVTVWDQEDDFGNGPHPNTTSVTIFIITSDNTVDFRFYNSVDEVQRKEDDMLTVISEVLSYNAYKQNIDEDLESSEEMTIASLYFVNDTTVQAIPAETILRSVSNINVYSQLVSELRNRTGLILMSFPSNASGSENLEEVLKAWLVGVSVVLGALCLILLVTFVLKTRELNNRIKNLTTNKFGSQESGLNRLGISAPTTNKHAIEGSNPIFNLNKDDLKRDMDKYDNFDGQSIRSGDSDLIGIEDNPEFDYHHDNRSQHI